MNDPFGWVGQTIDDAFLVEEVVGEGGFAVVYRGHHKGFDEKVAIKALKFPAKLGESERARFLESFTSEGKLLRKLSSADASIVQALDVGAAESPSKTWTPYLVLEWLEGESLDEDLKRRKADGKGGRTLADAMALLEPAVKGLGTAHGMGVAHRDIKPANLFLVKKGTGTTLKVVDFGIAKVMTETEDLVRAHEATGESIHAFSPRYGAPEQFDRRFGATGPWTDVFAIALVLEELVAGKSPMTGDTSQLFLAASNTEVRPTLKTMGVEETDAVDAVLTKALAVEPKERYQDANELWTALRHAVESGDTVLSQRTEGDAPQKTSTEIAPTKREGTAKAAESAVVDSKATTKAAAAPPGSRGPQVAVAGLLILGAVGIAFVIGRSAGYINPPDHPDSGLTAFPNYLAEDAASPAIVPDNTSAPQVPGFSRYVNDKYKLVVDIPAALSQYDESSTGNGRTYKTPDGQATLQIVAGELVGGIDNLYLTEVTRDTKDLGRWLLPVVTRTPDMFVLVGYEKDTEPFTEKVIVTGGIYARMVFTYPPALRAQLEPTVPHVRDSFSFTAVSNTVPAPAPLEDAGAAPYRVDPDALPSSIHLDDGTWMVRLDGGDIVVAKQPDGGGVIKASP